MSIYIEGEGPREEYKLHWGSNGQSMRAKNQKVGKVQKVKVTVYPVAFSAQPSTCNSYNFCNCFPNQLQQVLLESLEILFSDGSS